MSRAVSARTNVPASDTAEPWGIPHGRYRKQFRQVHQQHSDAASTEPADSNTPELMKAVVPDVWEGAPKAWTALGRASIASV